MMTSPPLNSGSIESPITRRAKTFLPLTSDSIHSSASPGSKASQTSFHLPASTHETTGTLFARPALAGSMFTSM